jgi:hypothetical protein
VSSAPSWLPKGSVGYQNKAGKYVVDGAVFDNEAAAAASFQAKAPTGVLNSTLANVGSTVNALTAASPAVVPSPVAPSARLPVAVTAPPAVVQTPATAAPESRLPTGPVPAFERPRTGVTGNTSGLTNLGASFGTAAGTLVGAKAAGFMGEKFLNAVPGLSGNVGAGAKALTKILTPGLMLAAANKAVGVAESDEMTGNLSSLEGRLYGAAGVTPEGILGDEVAPQDAESTKRSDALQAALRARRNVGSGRLPQVEAEVTARKQDLKNEFAANQIQRMRDRLPMSLAKDEKTDSLTQARGRAVKALSSADPKQLPRLQAELEKRTQELQNRLDERVRDIVQGDRAGASQKQAKNRARERLDGIGVQGLRDELRAPKNRLP